MRRQRHRVVAFSLLLLLLCGCGSNNGGKTFRMDIAAPVDNLDPQFAAAADALSILHNTQEGLLLKAADQSLQPGLAESYTLSADMLTYTFILRDAVWQTGEAITSGDFVFAFQRMFGEKPSPQAVYFASIQNAGAVLAGELPPQALGVSAPDKATVQITLDYPDPLFLERLTLPAAAPCNREFFEACRGRYGLEADYLSASGPFYVHAWNSRTIELRKNEHYHSPQEVLPAGVVLYIGQSNPIERFQSAKTDLVFASVPQTRAVARGAEIEFEKTTWCIAFNLADPACKNALLRQSLAASVNRGPLAARLREGYAPATALLPPALADTVYFYEGEPGPAIAFDTETGRRLLGLAAEAFAPGKLPPLQILVPTGGIHPDCAELLAQDWRVSLGLDVSVEALPPDQLQARLQAGDYSAALLPFTARTSRASDMLAPFAAGQDRNLFYYQSPIFNHLYGQIAQQRDARAYARSLISAQANLLSDAVLIPLYTEAECYLLADGVGGISADAFGERIAFKQATKP